MTQQFPKTVTAEGDVVELRLLRPADEPAVLAFAQRLSSHELLFLPRDIRQPKVVAAWIREAEEGHLNTLLAWRGSEVVGCGAVARDRFSWSAHVAEIRVVLAPELRGRGLGTQLVQETFRLALRGGAEKIVATMTTDQASAVSAFEGLGFTPEAILRDHVRDTSGVAYDVVVLSHRVAEVAARLEAYGLVEG